MHSKLNNFYPLLVFLSLWFGLPLRFKGVMTLKQELSIYLFFFDSKKQQANKWIKRWVLKKTEGWRGSWIKHRMNDRERERDKQTLMDICGPRKELDEDSLHSSVFLLYLLPTSYINISCISLALFYCHQEWGTNLIFLVIAHHYPDPLFWVVVKWGSGESLRRQSVWTCMWLWPCILG